MSTTIDWLIYRLFEIFGWLIDWLIYQEQKKTVDMCKQWKVKHLINGLTIKNKVTSPQQTPPPHPQLILKKTGKKKSRKKHAFFIK